MNYGQALEQLNLGNRILRSGWNGKGMYLFLVTGWQITKSPINSIPVIPNLPFIAMKTADDKIVPWLASQTDMLAEDWMTRTE